MSMELPKHILDKLEAVQAFDNDLESERQWRGGKNRQFTNPTNIAVQTAEMVADQGVAARKQVSMATEAIILTIKEYGV